MFGFGNLRYFRHVYLKNVRSDLKRKYASQKKNNLQKKSNLKKYSSTINLPSTKFPLWIKNEERVLLDKKIEKKAQFQSLYNWQRENIKGQDYILHDGPPYANGSPHIGHAINKIIKDITVRQRLLEGRRINFKLGWDCHGLPIELKALSVVGKDWMNITPNELRHSAREFATSSIKEQKEAFKTWGLLTDLDSECYYTYSNEYIKNQFRKFYDLFEKGVIYKDLKPVYWSPSSRTALAEAELEYNEEHISKAIYVRFEIIPSSFPKNFSIPHDCNLYALIWTTTPWTLLVNEAIAYNEEFDYSLVKIDDTHDMYLMASKLIPDFEKISERSVTVIQHIPGAALSSLNYKHHFNKEKIFKFIAGTHIRSSKGTGLVHTAPAHGPDDYVLGLKYNLSMKCVVDEAGRFTKEVHSDFQGMDVLTNGNTLMLDKLKTEILYSHDFKHSYPYDWRSKKPVVLRSSEQWFMDTNLLKDTALNCLKNVTMKPRHYANRLHQLLQTRPFWCISRQRIWGVPIPVLYDTEFNEQIINRELIEHYCKLIDEHGTDFWWNLSVQELLPKNYKILNYNHIRKGRDILDIWFDSGISWSVILEENQVADMYIEGLDQCTGWFQSSLLTSVGLRNIAPFKNIYVHGFAVDENKYKMSKSLGNVVNPQNIIEGKDKKLPHGIDVLRWWVACHAVQHEQIPVTENTFKDSRENIQKLRLIIKFLLGNLNGRIPDKTSKRNFILDRYILHKLHEFHNKIQKHYQQMEYHKVCFLILDFVSNQISAIYVHLTKDRLYCEADNSKYKIDCQEICYFILEILLRSIAPIIPHLTEEVCSYHSIHSDNISYFRSVPFHPAEEWKDVKAENLMNKIFEIKENIAYSKPNNLSLSQLSVYIYGSKTVTEFLKNYSTNELLDILQISAVSLNEDVNESNFRIKIEQTNNTACERCRKFICTNNDELCSRCINVINAVSS